MSEVQGGCPFCIDNRKVDVIAWTSNGLYYLVKAHGHDDDYLIVPIYHLTNLWELDDRTMSAVKELLVSIPWYYHGVAYNLSLNIGPQAGQRIEHLHWWVVYRDEDVPMGLGLATLAKQARRPH